MKNARQKVWRLGEDEACRMLMEMGHTVLERNWRSGHLEVDIVTVDGRGIHFVEVKARRVPMQVEPEEEVDVGKQRKLTAAAARYVAEKDGGRLADMEVFFDIVAVVVDGDMVVRTEFFPEAYVPMFFGR
ncbi:MAG: YraN family protein [Bacteroidales bacterium]|nr:YraN family protein [Bacteroidales bacterium]